MAVMTDFEAIGIAEGLEPARDQQHQIEAWQHLIDTGLAWTLEGWFGRQAWALIEQGVCHVPQEKSGYVA